MDLDTLLDAFERDILAGRSRWIADLSESFREYPIGGHRFDVFVRGQTRTSGFLLSRFFAWTVLPNYKVSMYVKGVRDSMSFGRTGVIELLRTVKNDMVKRYLKWGWLIFFFEGDPSSQVSRSIEEYDGNDVGIGGLSTSSGALIISNNLLGRSLLKHFRLDKLVSELERSKSKQDSAS